MSFDTMKKAFEKLRSQGQQTEPCVLAPDIYEQVANGIMPCPKCGRSMPEHEAKYDLKEML